MMFNKHPIARVPGTARRRAAGLGWPRRATVLLLALLLGACGGNQQAAQPTAAPAPTVQPTAAPAPQPTDTGAADVVAVADIVDNPQAYLGKAVTVSGDVNARISQNAFRLDEKAAVAGGPVSDLLVVGAQQNLAGIEERLLPHRVIVTGTVENFALADVERAVGYDLQDDLYARWEGKPVLIATAIMKQGAVPTDGTPERTPAAAAANILSVADIMGDPTRYYSTTVTLQGEVQEVFGTVGLRLDEEALLAAGIDNDLLVISAQRDLPGVDAQLLNDWVQVTGVVRPLVWAEIERDYAFFQRTPEIEARFGSRPVLIADSVTNLTPEGSRAPQPDTNVTIADIMDDTAAYLGKTVTVNSDVEEVFSPNAFKLDEEAWFAGGIDNDLLVIGGAQNLAGIDDQLLNSRVRVTGTVRSFAIADIERQIGYDLDDSMFADWDGRPVLIADRVARVRGAPAAGVTRPRGYLTVADVVSNPAALDGKQVTVNGELEAVLGERALRLDEDAWFAGGVDNDLLVIVDVQNTVGINDQLLNHWVQVEGTVHRSFAPADIERQLGVRLGDRLADWEGQPVLVATRVARIESPAAPADTTPQSATPQSATPAAGETVTDILVIVTAPDRLTLLNRPARVENVRVQSVVGDRAFWVGPSQEQQLLVILDERATPGTATEGRYDINAGQTITINGFIRRLPSIAEAQQRWQLSADAAQRLQDEAVYLHADTIQILSR